MAGKGKSSGGLYGQDIPYYPNNPRVQEYEQDQRWKRQSFSLKMQGSKVQSQSFSHQRAVEHSKSFVNWGLADKIHGMNSHKLRLF